MKNVTKKIMMVILVILIGIVIEYLNSTFVHNTMIWLFNFIFVMGTIAMVLGFFWNLEQYEIDYYNATEGYGMEEKTKDSKEYLRKRYIENQLTDEEYTSKMARL